MKTHINTIRGRLIFLLALITLPGLYTRASAQQANLKEYIKIENYYKLKWGHAEEFINLWKKKHYPLLKKLKEKGDIISIQAEEPTLHSSEESSWDYKFILAFKNANLALEYSIVDPIKKQLFPD